MDLIKKLRLIERFDTLIRRKATGSPKELSQKIGISERQIYNIINEMRDMGAPIDFCSIKRSYYYQKEVTFVVGFLGKDNEDPNRIKGGKNGTSPIDFAFDESMSIGSYYARFIQFRAT